MGGRAPGGPPKGQVAHLEGAHKSLHVAQLLMYTVPEFLVLLASSGCSQWKHYVFLAKSIESFGPVCAPARPHGEPPGVPGRFRPTTVVLGDHLAACLPGRAPGVVLGSRGEAKGSNRGLSWGSGESLGGPRASCEVSGPTREVSSVTIGFETDWNSGAEALVEASLRSAHPSCQWAPLGVRVEPSVGQGRGTWGRVCVGGSGLELGEPLAAWTSSRKPARD